ncbi:twin-arginine translocation signal domain-containing protein [Bailinhaonella thermotolerans]|uniref:twin-arginine translocation signal domain-containing protein n=1 Tax=Bailinhaonella thermotolerans TaxID=1070861 RepID=UPI00192A2AD2|nr:twin-arginine translocation signal domain-containing protein [Bailinhaonella thermotolerans]
MIPRRRFLQAAAVTGAAASLPAVASPPAAASSSGAAARAAYGPAAGTITDLGPASVASPLGNGEFVGDVLYAGSRGLSPNVVGAYDLGKDAVTAHHDIPPAWGSGRCAWWAPTSTRAPTPGPTSTGSTRWRGP